mmetsp:Transcript_9239/g.20633  ORF Transcript_9239/g.20633 Transcript_9239/m.20633 type:complete len:309 (-) Transcript_9239:501-1427(-)
MAVVVGPIAEVQRGSHSIYRTSLPTTCQSSSAAVANLLPHRTLEVRCFNVSQPIDSTCQVSAECSWGCPSDEHHVAQDAATIEERAVEGCAQSICSELTVKSIVRDVEHLQRFAVLQDILQQVVGSAGECHSMIEQELVHRMRQAYQVRHISLQSNTISCIVIKARPFANLVQHGSLASIKVEVQDGQLLCHLLRGTPSFHISLRSTACVDNILQRPPMAFKVWPHIALDRCDRLSQHLQSLWRLCPFYVAGDEMTQQRVAHDQGCLCRHWAGCKRLHPQCGLRSANASSMTAQAICMLVALVAMVRV